MLKQKRLVVSTIADVKASAFFNLNETLSHKHSKVEFLPDHQI
ncbi:hypothetical protein HMPREF0021_00033 [Acinetobacter baumannii 6013150]|nr:hypothetical protein HMPREF0021_00033 [Acinetobacter baumannii 6013150]